MTEANEKKATSVEADVAAEAILNFKAEQTLFRKKEKKWIRILRLFLNDGASFNRFEAERHGDHYLHSTISSVRHDYGILFDDVYEEVPALGGSEVARVKRYWLHRSEENLNRVRDLLGVASTQSMATT